MKPPTQRPLAAHMSALAAALGTGALPWVVFAAQYRTIASTGDFDFIATKLASIYIATSLFGTLVCAGLIVFRFRIALLGLLPNLAFWIAVWVRTRR